MFQQKLRQQCTGSLHFKMQQLGGFLSFLPSHFTKHFVHFHVTVGIYGAPFKSELLYFKPLASRRQVFH